MAEMRGLFETLCIELGQVGVSHELRVRAAILEILAVVVRVRRAHLSSAPRGLPAPGAGPRVAALIFRAIIPHSAV